MSLDTFQSDLATVLGTVAELAGVEIMLELPEDAPADELDAQDAVFEREISRKGFIVVVSTPRANSISAVRGGGVHLGLLCQVAFIENPAINRMAADPARPEIVPANKRPLVLIRAAMGKLIAARYEFPDQMLTAPEQDLEGLNLHGLLVLGKDDVRAT